MAKKRSREEIQDKILKKFVRYDEGANLYSVSENKFREIARAAGACYKIGQVVLVNCDILEEYMENFRLESNDERWKEWE